ncbi:FUSC family protein [Asaia prunellae]|uniref:FUSC family protein n=1 Tax=Asaia prunellae TaxID=610245 RepID=UPI000ADD4D71|nr:FUSC family protein [Asaia prunellae]
MTEGVQTRMRWWPLPGDLPNPPFPPGWIGFSLRSWAAICLALATAFWAQLDAPAGAAVTVMIITQPLRGQALSKAIYRLIGTGLGVIASILLIACFSQDRGMLLGGCALWMAGCTYIGSLERHFRSYGALLAGYTIALVAINVVDTPHNVFDVAVSRASCVAIGIASVAFVNMLTGSPKAWQKLADGLEIRARQIREFGHRALQGESVVDAMETTALAGDILSLSAQITYAKTEIDRSTRRTAGARLAIIGMLTVLGSGRAIAHILRTRNVSALARRHVLAWHELREDHSDRYETVGSLIKTMREEQPDYHPCPADAHYLERAAVLLSNRLHISTGINTLQYATPAGEALKLAQIVQHPDHVAAFINAVRVLLGFSITAGLCIASGQPASMAALSQAALILTLASTALDTSQFGLGAILGLTLAVFVAIGMNYLILPHIAAFAALALVFLPHTIFACVMLMNARTSSIGFNYGAFFPVILGLSNHHDYDPIAFISRNIFFLLSGVISFVILVLLFPPTPRSRRFRIAASIGQDLEAQLSGKGKPAGAALLSLKYDRLVQLLTWTKQLHAHPARNQGAERPVNRHVFNRLVALEDLTTTLARIRHYLREADGCSCLAPLAGEARHLVNSASFSTLALALPRLSTEFLALAQNAPPRERTIAILCAGSLEAVHSTLAENRSTLMHFGLGRSRW